MFILLLALFIAVFSCTTISSKKDLPKAFRLPDVIEKPVVISDNTNKPSKPLRVNPSRPPKKVLVLEEHPEKVIAKANTKAKRNPDAQGYYNSSMIFDWEPNVLYQVYTAPFRVTVVSLEQSEQLISVVGGDDVRWIVNESSSGMGENQKKLLLIKPVRSDIPTNIVITTDRRIYHLELHSLSSDTFMANVSWNYPSSSIMIQNDIEELSLNNKRNTMFNTNNLNFKYHFVTKEKPKWMPLRIFDDGHKTFILFSESMHVREAPGLFALGNNGEGEIINYRVNGSFYEIDKLLDIGELRLGDQVVGFERVI